MATQGMGDAGRDELQRGCLILGAKSPQTRLASLTPRKDKSSSKTHTRRSEFPRRNCPRAVDDPLGEGRHPRSKSICYDPMERRPDTARSLQSPRCLARTSR